MVNKACRKRKGIDLNNLKSFQLKAGVPLPKNHLLIAGLSCSINCYLRLGFPNY